MLEKSRKTEAQILQMGKQQGKGWEALEPNFEGISKRNLSFVLHISGFYVSVNQATKLNTCFLKAPHSWAIRRKNTPNKILHRFPIPRQLLLLSMEETDWAGDVLPAHLQGVGKWKQLRLGTLKSYQQSSNHELSVPNNILSVHFWNSKSVFYLFIWDRTWDPNLFWFSIQMSTVNGILL